MTRIPAARAPLAAVAASVCLLATLAWPASASHEDALGPEATAAWETPADGGTLTDDVALHATASRSLNNSVETLFVTGTRAKTDASIQLGIDDLDVVTTAFDVATGAVRWTSVYDAGLGIDDAPAGIELDWNNNIIHVIVQSGPDVAVVTYAVSSGNELSATPLEATTANATTIRMAGFSVGIAGQQDGKFFFTVYESGPEDFAVTSAPVTGEAYDVAVHNKTRLDNQGDPEWGFGSSSSYRTYLTTGRVGLGSHDVYTAAFRQIHSTTSPLWSTTWDGPDAGVDEGLVAETGWVRREQAALGWTAARSQDAGGNWDIVIRAHDLDTGAPVWTGDTRTWAGPGNAEDTPVAMWYADGTQTLYVTGTTDLGPPHGTDIVTLAYDGFTGDLKAEAFSSGNVSNGDDAPTDVTATHDGQVVVVSVEIEDQSGTGPALERAGLLAFDAHLDPLGSGLLSDGEAAPERAVGAAIDIFQGQALLGGSSDPQALNRQDLAGASFSLVPEPGVLASLAAGAALLASLARRRGRRAAD